MTELFPLLLPEILLTAVALVLMVMGISNSPGTRKAAPILALVALAAALFATMAQTADFRAGEILADQYNVIRLGELGQYVKMLTCGVGMLLVLLAWPSNEDGTGNPSIRYGTEGSEFFGLMLLALTGVLLTSSANDMVLLFLALELASLPTYVMVSISRPLAVAQEAGVKYFFLGAMSAAIMLFGFSYLYGTTGSHDLHGIMSALTRDAAGVAILNTWQLLAFLMILLGLAFKIAAFPLHFYAADVYQGAATPVTAFLAFVPKTTGFVAIIKVLAVAGGGAWIAPHSIANLLMVLAILTMTIGNVLGLLQYNVKRVLAYSSIAHSGYMLVGLTALMYAAHNPELNAAQRLVVQSDALKGVLFYLAAYGIVNAGSFGVLMLLPTREPAAAGNTAWAGTSAETFEDIAGTGRTNVGLGLAMAVCCLSLTGLPLTVGFFGKFYLIVPALSAGLIGLAIITVINAAISAAYYLRIIAAMFLRPEPAPLTTGTEPSPAIAPVIASRLMPAPIVAAIVLSVAGTLLLGVFPPAIAVLSTRSAEAAVSEDVPPTVPRAAIDVQLP